MSSADPCKHITNKDVRKTVRDAIRAGCDARITGKGHVQLRIPGGGIVVVGGTQPAARTVKNLIADLARAGLTI